MRRSHARQRRTEPLWSPADATGRNRWQMGRRRERLRQAKAVALGCDRLPPRFHGKEGVDGSSPSEGLPKVPANRHFVVVYSANTRTHSGHICGTRDARRRLASSSDTSVTRLVDTLTREITRKETTSVATVGEILTPSQRERVSSRSRPTGRPLRARFRCHRSPANPDLDDPSQPECSLHAPGPSVQRFGDQCVP
jgi:hypothetical protein